jgi:catechol-2,3-dioxygenase
MSYSTIHDIGATFAYHGHLVSLLWQSKQARTASSRVRGLSHFGSRTVGGLELDEAEQHAEDCQRHAEALQVPHQEIHTDLMQGGNRRAGDTLPQAG